MKNLTRIYRLVNTSNFKFFNSFKNKQQTQDQQTSKNKKAEEEQIEQNDDELTKQEYIQKIRKDREKKEKQIEESRELEKQYDRQKIKENQIKYGQFDARQIQIENINIFPNKFEHQDQLFYYIEKLNTRLTEENLMKCIQSFLNFSDVISSSDIERHQFYLFIEIIENHLNIISNKNNLIQICQFSDLYCISNPNHWENLERRILRDFSEFTLDERIVIFTSFANQNEGSEYFYNKIEKFLEEELEKLTINQAIQVSTNYKNVQFGTVEIIAKIMRLIIDKFESAKINDIILLSGTLIDIQKINTDIIYEKMEKFILNQDLSLCNQQIICQLAKNFGLQKGSLQLFQALEKHIDHKNGDLKLILDGFIFTYRGSKTLFENMNSRIEQDLEKISITELAKIVKSFYIVELENPNINKKIEAIILNSLQDVSFLTIEEIFEVFIQNRLLKVTIQPGWEVGNFIRCQNLLQYIEIAKHHDLVRGFHAIYTQSGLISQKTLQQLESVS